MNRFLVVIALLILGSAALAPAEAQVEEFYVAQWVRFFTSEVYRIDRSGTIKQTVARMKVNQVPVSLVQDEHNAGIYIFGCYYGQPGTGFVEHVDAKGVHTTVNPSTPWATAPVHLLRDGDGRWLALDNDLIQPRGVVTYDLQGRVVKRMSHAVNLHAYGAAAIHPETGRILVRAWTFGAFQNGYFHVDPNTGAWVGAATTTGTFGYSLGAREPIYDATFNGFWDYQYDQVSKAATVHRISKAHGLSTFAVHPGLLPVSIESGYGRAFAKPLRILTASAISTTATFTIHDMDRSGALTSPASLPGSGVLWLRTDLLRKQSRHLTWFMNKAPHDRRLVLSYPAEAGRPYVLGLSMSGASPGVPLADGRTLPLNPDALTAVCAKGGIPGVVTGTIGYLGTSGSATAHIDVTRFAKILKGMRVVASAVVLDPKAPSGIAIVSNVTGFTVK